MELVLIVGILMMIVAAAKEKTTAGKTTEERIMAMEARITTLEKAATAAREE